MNLARLPDDFQHYLAERKGQKFGVAVSGGSDSLALLHLVAEVVQGGISVASVDHGFRAEAAQECEFVSQVCADLGVPHTTLEWRETHQGNLQDAAREARFGLLAQWAKERGIDTVLLGHTADDQAETVLMRLARSAGVDGLAGISPKTVRHGIEFLRPLLGLRRSALQEYLEQKGQTWISDPSNQDMKFERVRARKAIETLDINVEALADVAVQMREASQALKAKTQSLFQQLVQFECGDACVDWQKFLELDPEFKRRLLIKMLTCVAPQVYPPRRAELARLLDKIGDKETGTLFGCHITTNPHLIRVTRELNAVRDLSCATTEIWDKRWRLDGPHNPAFEVRALGEQGLAFCPDWRETGFPRRSLLASPAIWNKEVLIAAPLAGLEKGWSAKPILFEG